MFNLRFVVLFYLGLNPKFFKRVFVQLEILQNFLSSNSVHSSFHLFSTVKNDANG
jgi:hypothetical protein